MGPLKSYTCATIWIVGLSFYFMCVNTNSWDNSCKCKCTIWSSSCISESCPLPACYFPYSFKNHLMYWYNQTRKWKYSLAINRLTKIFPSLLYDIGRHSHMGLPRKLPFYRMINYIFPCIKLFLTVLGLLNWSLNLVSLI